MGPVHFLCKHGPCNQNRNGETRSRLVRGGGIRSGGGLQVRILSHTHITTKPAMVKPDPGSSAAGGSGAAEVFSYDKAVLPRHRLYVNVYISYPGLRMSQ